MSVWTPGQSDGHTQVDRHTCNAPRPSALFLTPLRFSSGSQRCRDTWTLIEADRMMDRHRARIDRWMPTGCQSQTHRQIPMVTKVGHSDR